MLRDDIDLFYGKVNIAYAFEHESYLICLNIRKFRHVMSKFRSGFHNLEIEIGRHDKRARNERICRLCNSSVEDEAHFFVKYRVYSKNICHVNIILEPNINKFYILMSSKSESYMLLHHIYSNCVIKCLIEFE